MMAVSLKNIQREAKSSYVCKWLMQTSYLEKRLLVLGLISRVKSPVLLNMLDSTLSPFAHKDLTYARSQCQLNLYDNTNMMFPSHKKTELCIIYIRNVWKWFAAADTRSQTSFIYHIINEVYDSAIMNEAYSLVKLISCCKAKQQGTQKPSENDDSESVSATVYSFTTDQHPELYLLADTKSSFRRSPDIIPVVGTNEVFQKKMSIFGLPSKHTKSNLYKNLCCIAPHKDFITCLPIHLAKSILCMLDQRTLLRAKCVCKHWKNLAGQVLCEVSTSQDIQEEAMLMQDLFSVDSRNESYWSKIVNIAIPHCTTKHEKERIVTYHSAEDRNIYCGAYNVLILSNETNSKRVVHYSGGGFVACGFGNGAVQALDISTGQFLTPTHFHPGTITTLYASCQQTAVIYSGSYDTTIRCWHVGCSGCKQIMYGHRASLTCMDLEEQHLVSGSKDGLIKVWSTLSGKCKCTFRHAKFRAVDCVKIKKHSIVSSCSRGMIKVWCLKSRKLHKVLMGHESAISSLCMDDYFIISGSKDGYVLNWTKETDYKNTLQSFRHPKAVLCVQLLFLRIISGCLDGKLRIFHLLTGQCLRVVRGNSNCDPILSLHATCNRILVNTIHNLLLMQFEESSVEHPTQSTIFSKNKKYVSVHEDSTSLSRLSTATTMKSSTNKQKQCLRSNQTGIEGITRSPHKSSHTSHLMTVFSNLTTGCPKNGQNIIKEKDTKTKEKQHQSSNIRKDGVLLRIRNLQHCTQNSIDAVCTVINAASSETRDLLQHHFHQDTTQIESSLSKQRLWETPFET